MGLNGKSVFFLQLEAISEMNPVDLRKQLRVEFKGEEGLDEGGLQKELFQLLIEQLLDPMYGECMYMLTNSCLQYAFFSGPPDFFRIQHCTAVWKLHVHVHVAHL